MPGLAAVKHTDSAGGLRQPPSDAQADDAGADDDCLRPMDRKYDRFVNDGLPSPGMPGQVQWVCSQPPVRARRAAGRHPSLVCNFRPSLSVMQGFSAARLVRKEPYPNRAKKM